MEESPNCSRIRAYYKDVDRTTTAQAGIFHVHAEPLARVMDLFAPDANYVRGNQSPFMGYQAIEDFFAHKRPLCGTHYVMDIKESVPDASGDTTVTAYGHFSGTLCRTGPDGQSSKTRTVLQPLPAELDFTDTWVMHQGKVAFRLSEITPTIDRTRTGMQLY